MFFVLCCCLLSAAHLGAAKVSTTQQKLRMLVIHRSPLKIVGFFLENGPWTSVVIRVPRTLDVMETSPASFQYSVDARLHARNVNAKSHRTREFKLSLQSWPLLADRRVAFHFDFLFFFFLSFSFSFFFFVLLVSFRGQWSARAERVMRSLLLCGRLFRLRLISVLFSVCLSPFFLRFRRKRPPRLWTRC